ncbi:MAG: hypothetical protein HQL94_09850, partial [Magnetococcales bacterium]|nr:hypothetical protein [Magnetococcales bacterium]
ESSRISRNEKLSVKKSSDGKLLENLSFAKILFDNGLREMLLAGDVVTKGPIHMNQISIAMADSRYWKRGDLLISARNLNSIFLYNPSSNEIVWYQQGPWMNQHSARFVDDHRISVFDNNVFNYSGRQFVTDADINRVFVYDFDTKEATQPFAALLAEAKPRSLTEGRAQVLPDGGLFFEETNSGRHLRFTKDRLLWSRINYYDKEKIGMVAWSRYYTADEIQPKLQALADRQCEKTLFSTR